MAGVTCRIHLEMWKHWKAQLLTIVVATAERAPSHSIHHTLAHLPHSIPSSPTATCLASNSIIYRTSLSHWRSSYPFLFALRVISLSFHLSNWSACLFALLLSSNCSLMCHNCKVRQGFYSHRFSACIFMAYVLGFLFYHNNFQWAVFTWPCLARNKPCTGRAYHSI